MREVVRKALAAAAHAAGQEDVKIEWTGYEGVARAAILAFHRAMPDFDDRAPMYPSRIVQELEE